MKKVTISIGMLLLMLIFGTTVSAQSTDINSPENVLKNAYNSLVKGDIKGYAENVVDERYATTKDAIEFYEEAVKFNPIVRYEIVDVTQINEDTYKITIIEEYAAESTFKTPVTLKKIDGKWKIYVSKEPLELSEYDILKPTNEAKVNYNASDDYTIQEVLLRSFNVNITNNIQTSSFTSPSRGLILHLSSQKPREFLSSFTYRMIGKYVGSNKQIASKTVSGSKTNYRTSFGLSDLPSSMYLDIRGNGTSKGGIYY